MVKLSRSLDSLKPSSLVYKRPMIGVENRFPDFRMRATVSLEKGKEYTEISSQDLAGRWAVVFFWPLDFSFVCPTEIAGFNQKLDEFKSRGADVYGASTDSEYVHLAWRREHEKLHDLKFPMLADNKKDLSTRLGILHPELKVPLRATYIIDPEGKIRWMSVNDMKVGRNVDEVLRVLDALQTEKMAPCGWKRGDQTISEGN